MFKKQHSKESHTSNKFEKWASVGFHALLTIFLASLLSIGYSYFFDTPEEYTLKQENAKYKRNFKLINHQLDSIRIALDQIQEKDDHLYRLVLGVAPVSEEIRQAGIGGSELNESTRAIPSDTALTLIQREIGQMNAKLTVQSVSFQELTKLATENVNRIEHRPSIFPIAPNELIRFASGFGYRTHPIFKIRKFHKGIDLTALKGTPVHATAKGKVIIAGNLNDGYGNKIVIDHGYGFKTVYAHLHKITVKNGQNVAMGDVIGQVGTTGISEAPHLHYEVRVDDKVENPMHYIFKDITAEEYQLLSQR